MLRVLSLFSGIGAFEVALDELNIEWRLDHYCEIDKYASQAYNAIHFTDDSYNLKDVTNVDYSKIGDIDLITYGFPCQDISLAGNQKGFYDEDGNLTRSGLFFNAASIIAHTKPKFAIFENVKNLTSKKFKKEFETVLSVLDELGYNTYWQVLNAKDYGIPQNRERVFGISIRKDIDRGYVFPQGVELTLRLKDMLEEQIEERYYLSDKMVNFFKENEKKQIEKGNGFRFCVTNGDCIAKTITTRAGGRMDDNFIKVEGNIKEWKQRGAVYGIDGIGPTLCATDYKTPKLIVHNTTEFFRIRKLTPRECWRLMGFKDKYFDRVKGVSNTQLYKQAGNSIVVDVLKAIFEEMSNQYPEYFTRGDEL